MRIVAIILVALGALGLGFQSFSTAAEPVSETPENAIREQPQTVWVPPVVSGIAVVSGLIVLASIGRRDDL